MLAPVRKIVLVTQDTALAQATQAASARVSNLGFEVLAENIRSAVNSPRLSEAATVIVDLNASNRDELVALQGLMTRFAGAIPVVVLTEAFDDAVGRWFLQIRVSDFMRKPVRPEELVQVCVNLLGVEAGSANPAFIRCFIPAAGGVGNTTLSVEAAVQLAEAGAAEKRRTCIFDLDFQNDSCASHLDIEPRLDLREIGEQGERLDAQLLEVMGSKHASGLILFGAVCNRPDAGEVSLEAVMRMLDVVASHFDQVVLDLPRGWQSWTVDILHGSDKIYVVTDMTVPGLRSAKRAVQRIIDKANPGAVPQVIVNRAEKQGLFGSGLRTTDAERVLEENFAGAVSNSYALVREAIDRGVTLETVKPGNAVSKDLKKILFA